MANFGFDWVFLVSVKESELFEYEKLLYNHGVPFKSIKTIEGHRMEVPEKYSEVMRLMIEDYQHGILTTPVNTFNPRYSTFERGAKIRQIVRRKKVIKGNFLFILVLMMIMMAIQLLMYLRK